MKATFNEIIAAAANAINAQRACSTWTKAVKSDALDFLDKLNEWNECKAIAVESLSDKCAIYDMLLNGRKCWHQYSCDGCALICGDDIKAHYLTPSERRKYKGETVRGRNVLSIQADALFQAAIMVARFVSQAAHAALNE